MVQTYAHIPEFSEIEWGRLQWGGGVQGARSDYFATLARRSRNGTCCGFRQSRPARLALPKSTWTSAHEARRGEIYTRLGSWRSGFRKEKEKEIEIEREREGGAYHVRKAGSVASDSG